MDEQSRLQKVNTLAAKLDEHRMQTLSKLETLTPHEQEKVIDNYNKSLAVFFKEAHKSHLAPESIAAPLKTSLSEHETLCNDCKEEISASTEPQLLCDDCKEEVTGSTEPQLLCDDCKEEIAGPTEPGLLCDECQGEEEGEQCNANACVCGDAGVHFSRFALNDDIVNHYGYEPDHKGLITASKHDVIPLAYLGMVEQIKD